MLTKVDLVYVMELINLHLLIDAARIASASFICGMPCEGMDKVKDSHVACPCNHDDAL